MKGFNFNTYLKVPMLALVFSSASINTAKAANSNWQLNAPEFYPTSMYKEAYLNDEEYQQNPNLLNIPYDDTDEGHDPRLLPRNKNAIDVINLRIINTIKAITTSLNKSSSKSILFTEARKLLKKYNQNDLLIKSVRLYLYAPLSCFIDELYQKVKQQYKTDQKPSKGIKNLRLSTDKIWREIIQIFLLSIVDRNVNYDVLSQMFCINHMQKIIPSEERKLQKIFKQEDIIRAFQPTNVNNEIYAYEIYAYFSYIINIVDKDLYFIRSRPDNVETIQNFAYTLNQLPQ